MRQLGSFSDDPQKDHCDIRRRRHLFRCWHRGTQGTTFAASSPKPFNTLGSKQLTVEALLDCTDADLFDWAIVVDWPSLLENPTSRTLLRVRSHLSENDAA
jgi:succinate dehydrogenase flavin-adding protein (antitoxin of CptAB toxin-antitoxin module)